MYTSIKPGTAGVAAATAGVSVTALPVTGVDAVFLLAIGLALVAAGFLLLRLRLQTQASGR